MKYLQINAQKAHILLTTALLCLLCSASSAKEDLLATPEMKKFAPKAVELGWQYLKNGETETALRRFKMATRHDADFAPAHYGIAYTYSILGNLDAAIKAYRKTLKPDGTHLYANANLGYALLQKNEDKEALKYLDKALSQNPKCSEAHLSYANYYAKHEKWEKVENSANRAIALGARIHPEFRKMLTNKGATLTKEK